jgi:hypothetical protein
MSLIPFQLLTSFNWWTNTARDGKVVGERKRGGRRSGDASRVGDGQQPDSVPATERAGTTEKTEGIEIGGTPSKSDARRASDLQNRLACGLRLAACGLRLAACGLRQNCIVKFGHVKLFLHFFSEVGAWSHSKIRASNIMTTRHAIQLFQKQAQ